MKLYEITEQYRLIEDAIDEAEGELTPAIEQALSELNDRLADKVDAIGAIVREAKAEHIAFKEEARRLLARSVVALNKSERLKTYLQSSLTALGLSHVVGYRFSARVATASMPTITWEGGGDPPANFRCIKVELDGKAAHEAFKAGMLPEGFKAVQTKYLDLR